MSERPYRGLIPIIALLAVLPMLLQGPSCGHDFDFHLLSWLETSTQMAHFQFPHWAYTPAWNAGEPRFIFYPPLSWTLGGLLGLLLPWTLAPAAYTWVCLTLSGASAYRLACGYAQAPAATLAATVYMVNPYMLFTAYERTAYGELLAAAMLPLLFRAALAQRVRVVRVATAVALLWLANAPAAVMGCYALALVTIVRLIRETDRVKLAGKVIAATALGMALAAFYIVPAAYEQRFVQVQMAVTTGMRVSDHFLFHRMAAGTPGFTAADIGFHDAVVRTASIIAVLLLAAIFTLMKPAMQLVNRPRLRQVPLSDAAKRWSADTAILPLLLLALLIAFMLQPASEVLWRIAPKLEFLQFPWRLCALLAVILCVLVALSLSTQLLRFRTRLKPTHIALLAIVLAGVLIAPAWLIFRQPCDDEDAVPARVALFHSNLGTEPTDEYTPVDADPEALHPHDPPYWLLPPAAPIDAPAPANAAAGAAPSHLQLSVGSPQTLVLNRREYPGWRIELNHAVITPEVRSDGLIALQLPPGDDIIDLRFTHTPDRLAGDSISALAACGILTLVYRRRREQRIDSQLAGRS